jgi:acyl-CoA-binding protein
MSNLSDFESDDEDQDFNDAADAVAKNTTRIDQTTLLELYGFYKQATVGSCNISKPGIFNMQGRAKWSAWNDLKEMTQEEAKAKYIARVKALGFVTDEAGDTGPTGRWVSVSVMQPEPEPAIPEAEKTIFDFVQEKNFEKLDKMLPNLTTDELNRTDDGGMGLLHWAADRGCVKTLQKLLDQPGINVNIQDEELQTPLHYASSCGHLACVELLLKTGANKSLEDVEEKTSLDLAFNDEIRKLLTD